MSLGARGVRVFQDGNPSEPASRRYKALGGDALGGFGAPGSGAAHASPDGGGWTKARGAATPAFGRTAFYDARRGLCGNQTSSCISFVRSV